MGNYKEQIGGLCKQWVPKLENILIDIVNKFLQKNKKCPLEKNISYFEVIK